MFVTAIALAALGWTQAGAGANAAQTPSATLEVRLSGQITSANGTPQVTASDSDPRAVDSYIYVTNDYCGLGASSTSPASAPLAGWHVTASVVESGPDSIKAVVQWQRVWDHGVMNTHPASGVTAYVLKRDEPLLLDNITPVQSPCGATAIRLTATAQPPLVSRARDALGAWTFRGANPATGSGGGGRGGRGAGGAGRIGTNGVVASGTITGSGNGVGAGGIGATAGGTAFEPPPPGSLAAVDLWLLDRNVPPGSPSAFSVNQRYRMIALASAGSDFAFDPLLVNTPHGEITVRIYGRLAPVLVNGKLTAVDVQITRAVKGGGPPPIDVTGGATHTLSPLNSADVVDFQMPSGERDDPALLGDHHLSLRVRVR